MEIIEFDQECPSCGGTGLYRGFAEGQGFAVVCADCDGTGMEHFVHKYKKFTGRKRIRNVSRVLRVNPGISVGRGDKYTDEDFGGLAYKDWAVGKPFPPKSEMRKFVCPAWWYQSADYAKKPNWNECFALGEFRQCKRFEKKNECWQRFDDENNGGKKCPKKS